MDLVQSLSDKAQTASSNSTLSEIFTMHECLFMFIQDTKQLKAEGSVWFEEMGLANYYNNVS